jgi:hypothetical protein
MKSLLLRFIVYALLLPLALLLLLFSRDSYESSEY